LNRCRCVVMCNKTNEIFSFQLQYLDYGNLGKVEPEEMRKFPRELMLTACAHSCYVNSKLLVTLQKLLKFKLNSFFSRH
jgi:hypothetical protein